MKLTGLPKYIIHYGGSSQFVPIRQGKQRFKSLDNAKSLEKHGARPKNAKRSNIVSNPGSNLPKYDLTPHQGITALAGRFELPAQAVLPATRLPPASVMALG
ncbi:hypothetical protein [Glutamicibacter sp.]|uniref:hypothetical protein n=1 Tax=Glutamicibacter sp. TaxID=1931995 RepID=UPI003D6B6436